MKMKRKSSLFSSFQTKVTVILILAMLLITTMCNFLVYRSTLDSQFDTLRNKMMIIAQTAALLVDARTLGEIPLTMEGKNTPQYKIIADKLKQIKEVNKPIKYVYIMARTGQKGIWQFIVDLESNHAKGGKKELTTYPGYKYNAARFPEMLKGFYYPSADKKLEKDEWGVTLSGYAPIRDDTGRAVAVLGVDLDVDDVVKTQREAQIRAFTVLILGVVLSLFLGMIISRRITDPVEKLVKGTRSISEGNLRFRVNVEGDDEISELGSSFNKMAANLDESRTKLLNYFYDVVQALVTSLEAKDHYTRGHSERVSLIAEKIALKMGFSPEQSGLLREVALLHDIGKLGIHENILNKKEKLTDEEWEIIRRHPVVGEDILRPVLLTREMLAMVRSHHERYDGKGYPDKLSGENISIFAAIIAVADAYDAMTSPRAYRGDLGKEKALEEIRAHRGTQFNAKAVDAFLEVLKEMA